MEPNIILYALVNGLLHTNRTIRSLHFIFAIGKRPFTTFLVLFLNGKIKNPFVRKTKVKVEKKPKNFFKKIINPFSE